MLGIARGIVLVITDANTIQGLPDGFQTIANGTVLGIPNLLIIFLAIIAAIAWFVLNRTVFGRYVYSVGLEPGGGPARRRPGRAGHHLGVRDLRRCSPASAGCC